VNGVAALHSDLLKQTVLHDFAELWPERFDNVTNGVTPRRFVVLSNPGWRGCSTRRSARLGHRSGAVEGAGGARRGHRVPRALAPGEAGKQRGAGAQIRQRTGVIVDPGAMFDIQVKRIHEYKRQHLNVLHIVTLYQRLRRNPELAVAPRCFVFGGKAAPGYHMAS